MSGSGKQPAVPLAEQAGRVRRFVYQHFVAEGGAPPPNLISTQLKIAPERVVAVLEWLEREADALILLPGSPYIWMAEPFSAVPTDFPAVSEGRRWYGNCIWDAVAILALLGRDGRVDTLCPQSGEPLAVTIRNGEPEACAHRVHFAVAARDWWRSIGFT